MVGPGFFENPQREQVENAIAHLPRSGELYVHVMTRIDELESLKTQLIDRPPLVFQGPYGQIMRSGENLAFHYRSSNGNAQWRLLRGKNIWQPEAMEVEWFFANHRFGGKMLPPGPDGRRKTETSKRTLSLVVPRLARLSVDQLLSIASYYEELFPFPSYLAIQMFDSNDACDKVGDRIFPPLIDRDIAPLEGDPKTRASFWRQTVLGEGRLLIIYSDGKLKLRHQF